MAVHARYPRSSNLLLLNRTDQEEDKKERKETMDLRFSDSVSKNLGKRGKRARETNQIFSLPSQQQSGFVSTGLGLAFNGEQQIQMNQPHNNNINNNSASFVNSNFSEELFAKMAHHTNEIELFLIKQGEQLRQALAEKRRRHLKDLYLQAEAIATRKVREKQVELDQATCRTADLENRLNHLRSESLAWQTKALADQATAAGLHAQLQQVTAAQMTGECETAAEDSESAFVDPSRAGTERLCRRCRLRPACVVVFPCRHLCLCEECERNGGGEGDGDTCPVCCYVRSGTLKVFF